MILDRETVAPAIGRAIDDGSWLKAAVAFWGNTSATIFVGAGPKPVQILCNLESGACNPAEVAKLIHMFPGNVRSHPRLHAKVWCTNKVVIVGSSNASANGLMLEDSELDGWHEANVELELESVRASAEVWFDKLWNDPASNPISTEMLEEAERRWRLRRKVRLAQSKTPSRSADFLVELMANPSYFADRNILVTSYEWSGGATDKEIAAKSAEYGLESSMLGTYDGWHFDDESRFDDLPVPGTTVIDFDSGSSDWGVFTVPDFIPVAKHNKVPRIWVVRSESLKVGDTVFPLKAIRRELRAAVRSVKATHDAWMNLSDFAEALSRVGNSMPGRTSWRDDVLAALKRLGGEAPLADIYAATKDVRKRGGRTIPTSYQAVIRKELEYNSQDSDVFQGEPLFKMARGKGGGVWKLVTQSDL